MSLTQTMGTIYVKKWWFKEQDVKTMWSISIWTGRSIKLLDVLVDGRWDRMRVHLLSLLNWGYQADSVQQSASPLSRTMVLRRAYSSDQSACQLVHPRWIHAYPETPCKVPSMYHFRQIRTVAKQCLNDEVWSERWSKVNQMHWPKSTQYVSAVKAYFRMGKME